MERSDDIWIPPLFYKRPPWHEIGDRVVNLKTTGTSFAPFGASGTVVGILGTRREEGGALEMKVEVLFDRPFIGGSSLNGRCKWGRGAIVDFDDIYNLNSWPPYVRPREKRSQAYFSGWDGKQSYYIPTFLTSESESELENEKGFNSRNQGNLHDNRITSINSAPTKSGNRTEETKQGNINQQAIPFTQSWNAALPKTLKSKQKQDEKPQKAQQIIQDQIIDVKILEGQITTSDNQEVNFNVQEFFAKNTTVSNTISSENLTQQLTASLKIEDSSKSKPKQTKLQGKSKEFNIVQRKPESNFDDPAIISKDMPNIQQNIDPTKKYSEQELLNQIDLNPKKDEMLGDPAIIGLSNVEISQTTNIVDVSQLESIIKTTDSSSLESSIDLKKLQETLNNQQN